MTGHSCARSSFSQGGIHAGFVTPRGVKFRGRPRPLLSRDLAQEAMFRGREHVESIEERADGRRHLDGRSPSQDVERALTIGPISKARENLIPKIGRSSIERPGEHQWAGFAVPRRGAKTVNLLPQGIGPKLHLATPPLRPTEGEKRLGSILQESWEDVGSIKQGDCAFAERERFGDTSVAQLNLCEVQASHGEHAGKERMRDQRFETLDRPL